MSSTFESEEEFRLFKTPKCTQRSRRHAAKKPRGKLKRGTSPLPSFDSDSDFDPAEKLIARYDIRKQKKIKKNVEPSIEYPNFSDLDDFSFTVETVKEAPKKDRLAESINSYKVAYARNRRTTRLKKSANSNDFVARTPDLKINEIPKNSFNSYSAVTRPSIAKNNVKLNENPVVLLTNSGISEIAEKTYRHSTNDNFRDSKVSKRTNKLLSQRKINRASNSLTNMFLYANDSKLKANPVVELRDISRISGSTDASKELSDLEGVELSYPGIVSPSVYDIKLNSTPFVELRKHARVNKNMEDFEQGNVSEADRRKDMSSFIGDLRLSLIPVVELENTLKIDTRNPDIFSNRENISSFRNKLSPNPVVVLTDDDEKTKIIVSTNRTSDYLGTLSPSPNDFKLSLNPVVELINARRFDKRSGQHNFSGTSRLGSMSPYLNGFISPIVSNFNAGVNVSLDPSRLSTSFIEPRLTADHLQQSFFEAISVCAKNNVQTAKQMVLKQCCQSEAMPFRKYLESRGAVQIKKLGEGSYGEVFSIIGSDVIEIVAKVVPIEGKELVCDSPQKTFAEILSEVVISIQLSSLRDNGYNSSPNYIFVHGVKCVKGSYPEELMEAWDEYDEHKKSLNDRPDFFKADQLFMLFEFTNGGIDLENFQFNNACQAESIFKQVACGLAVAENALKFEHRDLHWGNILIALTHDKTVTCHLNGEEIEMRSNGVLATMIDYTLSRLEHDKCTVYENLATEDQQSIFESQGDYQFEIYRLMKEHTKDDWIGFFPYTNLLWLHYLLDKLLGKKFRYKKSKAHLASMKWLEKWRKCVLSYSTTEKFIRKAGIIDDA